MLHFRVVLECRRLHGLWRAREGVDTFNANISIHHLPSLLYIVRTQPGSLPSSLLLPRVFASHARPTCSLCTNTEHANAAPDSPTNAGRRWRGAEEQESASARIPVRERGGREACFKPQPLDEERGRGGEEEERLRGMPRRWRGRFSHCVSTVERVSAIAMPHSLTSNARS